MDSWAIAAQTLLRANQILPKFAGLPQVLPPAECAAKLKGTHRRIGLAQFLADGILPAFPVTRRDAG